MATIQEKRREWVLQHQIEIDEKRSNFHDSIKILIVWLILETLCVWWLNSTDKYVHIEAAKAFGFTIAEATDRISGTYLFAWFVVIVVGFITFFSWAKCDDNKTLLKELKSKTNDEYVAEKEAEFRKLNIECPNCHNFFDRDEDDFNRYVVGSAKNAAKFIGGLAIREGAKIVGGMLTGGDGYATTVSGRAGGQLAKEIGLSNYDGWKHKCPYCKHKW